MTITARLFTGVFSVWLSSAVPQTADQTAALERLRPVQQLAKEKIPEFRLQIHDALSDKDKAIEASIEYRVVMSWDIQAVAYRDRAGDRRIDVSVMLLQLADWLSTAQALSDSHSECMKQYEVSLFGTIMDDRGLPNKSQITPVQDPVTYAQTVGGVCEGISGADISGNEFAKQKRLLLLGSSFHWVLSHELAHHLNGDVDSPLNAKEDFSIARSRAREKRADAFAFKVLERPGYDPILAFPAFLIVGVLGAPVEGESESDHPSGPWRMHYLADAIDSDLNDPQFIAYAKQSGNLAKLQKSASCIRKFAYQTSATTDGMMAAACKP